MSFPDQSHINKVRDALWQSYGNGASVMVGSGFSRNAVPVRPGTGNLPTWDIITAMLHQELYPREQGDIRHQALRTAQEYEAEFGRTELHNALRKLVSDNGYTPGSLHRRLLNLPWTDIYTTNWDTLLERTRNNVSEWDYSVVTSTDQIPMEPRPRIVKLHGSLPDRFPLIVTEEDYRTYPTKFAPFVNTVQQAMMETVLLLIGFSGEDPNFLNWSGWVRDNLGPSAPKIYLAGYLQLSQPRRRMLEEHNVVPIDLAQHPQSSTWQEQSLQHQYATEWILHTFENGKPYDVTDWPSLPSQQPLETPDYLQPVDTISSVLPQAEPTIEEPTKPSSTQEVGEIIEIWRHNRVMYPGWLTMPSSKRQEMEWQTEQWGHKVLVSFPYLTIIERLHAIREIVWREDILLVPMHPQFEVAIEETLSAIDCHQHILDGAYSPDSDWASIREGWCHAASALITAARFRHDRDAFERWIAELMPFQAEDTDLQHRIRHEQCLWAIYEWDIDSLEGLVLDWRTENCDPAWMMRKSAMLWEAGYEAEAEELLQGALAVVRAMPKVGNSVAGPSREAWATLVALGWNDRSMLLKRLRELAPLRCDPFHEQQSVLDAMRRNRSEEEPPAFDVNRRRGAGIHFSNYDPQSAAYRAARLPEVVGIPPIATSLFTNVRLPTSVWADVLKEAAKEIADENLEFAIRLVLRASRGDSDKTLGRVLSRTRLATLKTMQAESLAEACLRIIKKASPHPEYESLSTRAETAIEVLSRITIRLGPELAERCLDKALDLSQDHQLQKGTWAGPIRHLLERSWEALPKGYRSHRALGLLNAPIAGMDNVSPLMEYAWADPVELFANESNVLRRTLKEDHEWEAVIDLVIRGLLADPSVRRRASIRMTTLVKSGLLTEDESRKIARALWSERHTLPEELPVDVAMYDWGFLTLPEIEPGLAKKRFVAKWLPEGMTGWQHKTSIEIYANSDNGLNHDPQDVDSCLWQIGRAIMTLERRGQRLELSGTDKAKLQRLVKIWAEAALPEYIASEHPLFFLVGNTHKERLRAVSRVLPAIVGEVGLPDEVGEILFTKMQTLNESQVPILAMAVSVVKATPSRLTDVVTILRVRMTSDERELATDAVEGVRLWIETTLDPGSGILPPPDDLVREIGIAIASRRSPAMPSALGAAQWMFRRGEKSHKEVILRLALDGLRYLAEELRYDREHDNPEAVPSQRLLCAKLAAAMARDGLDQEPAVALWLEIAREDPLPEVRNAVALDEEVENDDAR